MSGHVSRKPLVLIGILAVLGLAACGGSDESASGTPAQSGSSSSGKSVTDQLFAGTATGEPRRPRPAERRAASSPCSPAGDVDYMDPGKTYYTYAIGIMNAMHRGLYAYLPGTRTSRCPTWPTAIPQIADDGKTVTSSSRRA